MFYLMKLIRTGLISILTLCFYICGITSVSFFSSLFCLFASVVMSFFDKKYSPHSLFYYWKSLLLCGVIKGLQLYLWIAALSSCGPVITVLFEQSPKVLFVIVGLFAHSYSSDRNGS